LITSSGTTKTFLDHTLHQHQTQQTSSPAIYSLLTPSQSKYTTYILH